MANKLSITYFSSRDNLGVVSDEEYESFKNLLFDALQEEWPDADVNVEDDDESSVDVSGVEASFASDVEGRVQDIINDVVESGDWEEEDDLYADEEEDIVDEGEDEN
jgi:hypothetical protein